MPLLGRSIYIVDLARILHVGGQASLLQRCRDSKFSSIWIRVGRGKHADPNLQVHDLPAIRAACEDMGIEVWGWHVPFCRNATDANKEADLAAGWVTAARFAGLIIDAERTPESPRFQGTAHEAEIYVDRVNALLPGRIAFSSHDQPSLHSDLPFVTFLSRIEDVLPQVYYKHSNVTRRLNKSLTDYKSAGLHDDWIDRFKPTGNISTDPPVGTGEQCVAAAETFMARVKALGLKGYSFWCWDEAPAEIWPFLAGED
jgi:hypothetical protein